MWREFLGRLEEAQPSSDIRDRFLGALAVASAIYGDAEKAMELLDRVRDAYTYVDSSLSVAVELCWKGFTEKAEMLISGCLKRMDELSPGEARALAPRLAYAKTLAEGVDEGLSVAGGEEGVWRCRIVLAVASAVVEAGLGGLDRVLGELDSCLRWVFDEEKAGVLLEAGGLLLRAGRADEAKRMLKMAAEAAMNLYDDFSKRMILSGLVPAMIDAGMLEEAVVLSGVLGLAGLPYLEGIGEAAGARVVEMPFEALDAHGKAVLALRGAEVSLSGEAAAKAAEYVRGLSGRSWYPELLARLAALQAKIGEVEEGKVNVEAAVGLARGVQLVKVAEAVAEVYAGYAERALERACREAETLRREERALVLVRAAAAWSKVGREERAEECFKEAAKLAAELDSSELLAELSKHLASSKEPGVALKLLEYLPDRESKIDLLAHTASLLVEEGREEGVKLAEEVRIMAEKGRLLPSVVRLAVALSRRGRVSEAQKLTPIIVEGVLEAAKERGADALRLLNLALKL